MTTVVPPTKRTCERCGRTEIWDEGTESWVATAEDGDADLGRPHCLHEWDINGSYDPNTE